MKSDPGVCKDLPPKIEQSHFVELTPVQIELYDRIQALCMGKLFAKTSRAAPSELRVRSNQAEADAELIKLAESDAQPGKFERMGCVLRMLHALRQVCNHPSNLDENKWPELKVPTTSA